ncbi:DUF726 domain-containing protein [Morganella morganii]|uniref:DUF726 domain-containing protein n=1 Tax=Morganella morganii TaxID=582 RepID=UPI000BBD29E2|nr:DUF726 domain-containing protein [Morganella morganii]ATF53183.1 hypothetical protein CO693_05455 [Morganella morganii]MDN3814158.1 DUF726 domain-containing protein [Morganella morganii]HCR3201611.1 DUF726 domain-containing protein [Morganella morganii]HDS2969658.1 DUF726 domain-containing protein [Morganella morganii subsp. morganii]
MTILLERYCSHCFKKSNQKIAEKNYLRRNVYICDNCQNFTLECRSIGCQCMTKGELSNKKKQEIKDQLKENKVDTNTITNLINKHTSWDDEFCAEHDGTIGSFKRLNISIDEISDYHEIIKRDSINLVKIGKISATAIAVGAATVATAGTASVAVASALGSTGLLGAAGTGTLISTLSGAALANASLAAIGGSVAGGTLIITACGAALGGTIGGAITNKYISEDSSFRIKKLHDHPASKEILFINGFLQENEIDFPDWIEQQKKINKNTKMYGTCWSSSTNTKLGKTLMSPLGKDRIVAAICNIGAKGGKFAATKLAMLANVASIGYTALANDWHVSMYRAGKTGALLADIVSRTNSKNYDFAGHSLGSRVIYYLLESLKSNCERLNSDNIHIENIYLLGGAVGNDSASWENLASLVNGKIYNCYSTNDDILKWMYQTVNIKLSNPIGYSPIETNSEKIINVDCSDIVNSHFDWKKNYSRIHQRITEIHAVA